MSNFSMVFIYFPLISMCNMTAMFSIVPYVWVVYSKAYMLSIILTGSLIVLYGLPAFFFKSC
jgi:hypothetical protein